MAMARALRFTELVSIFSSWTSRSVGVVWLVRCLGVVLVAASPASAQVKQVVGTESFGWTQVTAAGEAADGFLFVAYVDNAPAGAIAASCAVADNPLAAECSAPLPAMTTGQHVLQLTAVSRSTRMESPLSSGILLEVLGSPQAVPPLSTTPSPSSSPIPGGVCANAGVPCSDNGARRRLGRRP